MVSFDHKATPAYFQSNSMFSSIPIKRAKHGFQGFTTVLFFLHLLKHPFQIGKLFLRLIFNFRIELKNFENLKSKIIKTKQK